MFKKELFEDFSERVEAHAKGNKKEFGKALVVFSLESLAAFKETRSYLFQGGNGILLSIYTNDGSFFEDAYLFKKGDLRSVLLTKMIKLFGILKGFGIIFFLWFPILKQIFKTFEKISKSFKVLGGEFASHLAEEVGFAKRFSGNPMNLYKINDLLSQSFKMCAVLFG